MKIPEIELAFCNACFANCYCCSKTHGGEKEPFMSMDVFNKAVEDMKEIQFDIIQTGGDGDSFLHGRYLGALRVLRKEFPKAKIVLYSNMYLFNHSRTDEIVEENLIDELNTRIDSLDQRLFELCTGVSYDTCMDNIDYFIKKNKKNKKIIYNINYASMTSYKENCKKVLGKEPCFWDPVMDTAKDEFEDVKKHFSNITGKVNRIKMSLWEERNDPHIKPEPDIQCGRMYCFDSTCYVWPNGDVGICGYDDGQDTLIYGNIMNNTISELWQSESKKAVVRKVQNREIKGYPCINPKACLFY